MNELPKENLKIIPLLIMVVVFIAIGVGVYAFVTQTQGGSNTSVVLNVNKIVNTNSGANKNANTNVLTDCADITDYQTCYNRSDCLPVDLCHCTNDYQRDKRCGEEITQPSCVCDRGGFDYCEDLVCDGVNNTNSQTNVNISINTNEQLNNNSSTVNMQSYIDKTCTDQSDCGVFPCVNGVCLVQECTCSCRCPESTCGGSGSAAPGYCIVSGD